MSNSEIQSGQRVRLNEAGRREVRGGSGGRTGTVSTVGTVKRCRWYGRTVASVLWEGRLTFHHVTGEPARHNGGAPSVLIAYGYANANWLVASGLKGRLVWL